MTLRRPNISPVSGIREALSDTSTPLNPNLSTNPVPFSSQSRNRPFRPVNSSWFQQGVNLALTTVIAAAPFAQLDWSKSSFAQSRPPRLHRSNLVLTANRGPFTQNDFSRPSDIASVPGHPLQQNYQNFYANPLPFAQYNWPLTHTVRSLPPLSDQMIWEFVVPFQQYDWNVAQRIGGVRYPITEPPNLNLLTAPAAAPFIPVDWSRSFFPQAQKPWLATTALSLTANLGPFRQTDFGRPFSVARLSSPAIAYNQNLYTVVVTGVPFAQLNWAITVNVAGLPPQALPYNINIYVPPPAPPVVTEAFDPFVWRKYQEYRKKIQEAQLARQRAEDRAREIRRRELRDLVLDTTEAAEKVLIAAEMISADITAGSLADYLIALANAKSNREVERLVVRTERAIATLQQYLKDVADEEDDLEVILRDLF